jgi:hypothetical protein
MRFELQSTMVRRVSRLCWLDIMQCSSVAAVHVVLLLCRVLPAAALVLITAGTMYC